jgi:hypothetical protein
LASLCPLHRNSSRLRSVLHWSGNSERVPPVRGHLTRPSRVPVRRDLGDASRAGRLSNRGTGARACGGNTAADRRSNDGCRGPRGAAEPSHYWPACQSAAMRRRGCRQREEAARRVHRTTTRRRDGTRARPTRRDRRAPSCDSHHRFLFASTLALPPTPAGQRHFASTSKAGFDPRTRCNLGLLPNPPHTHARSDLYLALDF